MKEITIKLRMCLLVTVSIIIHTACTDDYTEINTDVNSIATVGPSELPFLFSKALTGVPIGGQTPENLFSAQYAQYFSNVTSYFPTDRLVIRMDWLRNAFNPIYVDVMPQLQTILDNSEENSAEHALAEIWWVYSFHRVTDYWGPIPYSKAGEASTSIPYDSQESIYNDFFERLDRAEGALKALPSDLKPFGSYDLMYEGDINKWIKFANTLRLRLAIRISKTNPELAKVQGEEAFSNTVLESSPEDDALIQQNTIDINPISQMSEWNEFRMSAAMESALVGYDDPRTPEYFLPSVNTGEYEGLRNGLSVEQLSDEMNSAHSNSHVGPRWTSPASGGIDDFYSTPLNVMSSAEAYFLRAEGALLGWEMGGSPEELYEKGIENSLMQWGVTDASVIESYINSNATPAAPNDFLQSPPIGDIPVKFDTTDEDIQFQQIFMQKWIALFPDGVEAWAEYRRSRGLPLYPVANSDNIEITDPTTQWIRRVPFLLYEKQSNGEAVDEAINLLGGPDLITTPLWWDKN
ncbi:SusD/RagB family nutrient-binding outer membrane lipoprotein [Arenibacter sp. M-2]|uniref:SusD/RagB family nutrient-binding outer membrane lipoprotein n=1 Tax=unclassified Arenibacter TaxID=2615047 RepID=UPI000D76581D|nr:MULTISPECIES: SusD/RagB family nutrient-binding outer membrane lipoprotein [unclassified Arenibacter]MDL5510331.1 SusD/RagB family nutrient-binding outer membrane lipoprotein [Arenibacter sp. M-2]PXX31193.1 SusD/RagB-like outer membrane lipoprotein [Arenibacter sp. ARW7G5Y1]